MVVLTTLQSVGYTAKFFKLPEAGDDYYMFDSSALARQPSYWNIVGIKRPKGDASFVDLQIFYISEDDLEYEYFSASQNAGNLLSISLEELQALIRFLEENFPLKNISTGDKLAHFSAMKEQELADLHYTKKDIQHFFGRYYFYSPSQRLQAVEQMSMIGLPSWIFEGRVSTRSSLFFATFEGARLSDPTFDLQDGVWRGTMRFDLPALSEFVFLLKQQVMVTTRFMQQDL